MSHLAVGSTDRWAFCHDADAVFRRCIIPTGKFGGGSIMLWMAIHFHGLAAAVSIQGTFNGGRFLTALNNRVPGIVQRDFPFLRWSSSDPKFQHWQRTLPPLLTCGAVAPQCGNIPVRKLALALTRPRLHRKLLFSVQKHRGSARPVRQHQPAVRRHSGTGRRHEHDGCPRKTPPAC